MFPLFSSSNIKRSGVMLLGSLLALTLTVPHIITQSFSAWTAQQGMSIDVRLEVEPPAYIYEWGVGRFSSVNSTVPSMVELNEEMKPKQLAGGNNHSLFAVNDGELWGVGNNTYGQLGNGTNENSLYTPTKVVFPEDTEIVDFSTVQNFSLAVDGEGQVWGWGDNYYGQLGNGTTTPLNTRSPTPTKAVLPDGVKAVAVSTGFSHSLALTDTGEIYAWGSGQYGKLGTGNTTNQSSPVKVLTPPGTVFVKVATSYNSSIALTDDGKIYTWGLKEGAGQTYNSATPTLLPFSETNTAINIAGGNKSGHAVLTDGSVWSWGGLTGDGTNTYPTTPVKAHLPDGVSIVQLSVAKSSLSHALALTDDGELYAWGNNGAGQLGDGTTSNQLSPVKVLLPNGVKVISVSASGGSSLALFDGADDGLSLLSGGEQSARATSKETAGEQGKQLSPELSADESVVSGEPFLSVSDAELSSSSVFDEGEPDEFFPSLSTTPHSIQSEDEQSGEEPTLLQSALFSESPLTVFFSTVVSFLAPETNFSLSPLHSRYVKGHASQWSV